MNKKADYIVPVYNKNHQAGSLNVEQLKTCKTGDALHVTLWSVYALPGREQESMRASILGDKAKYEKALAIRPDNRYLAFCRDSMSDLLKAIDDTANRQSVNSDIEQVARHSLDQAGCNANIAMAIYAVRSLSK